MRTCFRVGLVTGLALLAAGCGGGGSENPPPAEAVTLPGTWSGSWVLNDGSGGFQENGTMTVTFTLATGVVGGSLTSPSDICVEAVVADAPIAGALGAGLTFSYSPGGNTVEFTADFPADPINGTYEVTDDSGSGRCSIGWGGTFRLDKQ
jgi:hypothetical protein